MCKMNCLDGCPCADNPSKCKGGTYKTATPWKGATKAADKPAISGRQMPAKNRCGRRIGR